MKTGFALAFRERFANEFRLCRLSVAIQRRNDLPGKTSPFLRLMLVLSGTNYWVEKPVGLSCRESQRSILLTRVGFMDMMDAEILNDFVEESREHLADIEMQLLQIEVMGEEINDDLVNTVFRAIHSIKGAAGFLGLTQINQVSHRLENVLGKVRDHELIPSPFNVDVMLKAADRLSQLIEDIDSSNDTDNAELCEKLDVVLAGCEAGADAGDTATQDSSDGEVPQVQDSSSTESTEPSSQEDSEAQDENPNDPESPSPKQNVEEKLDEVEAAVAAVVDPKSASTAKQPTKKTNAKTESRGQPDSTIRVSVRVLDQLMNLAGELVLSRNQLLRALSDIPSSTAADKIASGIDQVTTELQEAIMQTRMQPIGNVFNKFPRVIRDLSSSLGKSIELKMDGAEVETDKTIIEAIADPLTHLIRNSCDHGIETPEKRLANGKSETGNVQLRAFHQAGKVMIEIIDDGAGMDPEKLRNLALNKGVITAEEAEVINDHDAVNLIFAPGFSTAETVTDVSGRGVGMDVVRTNIEQIGGNVEVESKLGEGSTIRIALPLTLAIVPSMIVSVGDRAFALPQANIVELVQTGGSQKRIERVSNADVLRLRGSLLPLVRLNHLLGIHDGDQDGHDETLKEQQLVVVESGRTKFAIAVDRVLDSEEIVVKPLGKHLSNLPLLAGATILGDGQVAMILDVAGVTTRSGIGTETEATTEETSQSEDSNADLQRLVLISLSEKDHFGVSMDIVRRIERVEASAIEQVGDRQVLQYRGSTLPLISIQDAIPVCPVDSTEFVHAIVFSVYGHEVGLITPYLDDIADCNLDGIDTNSSDPGVAAVTVVNGKTTRILDIYSLAQLARPDWFEQASGASADEEPKSFRILVCEDSKFFRNFLVNTLHECGHKIDAYEDGLLGYEALIAADYTYDLVLTDVEMPNLDGLGLSRRIRENKKFDDLSIIALTSLADQDSVNRGLKAGVTDYQVKMNKPELLAAIAKYGGHRHSEFTNGHITIEPTAERNA